MRTLGELRTALRARRADAARRRAPTRLGLGMFDSIHYVPASDWDAVVPPDRLFLRRPYLGALEASGASDLAFRYVLAYDGRRPVAAMAMQVLTFRHGEAVGSQAPPADGAACPAKSLVAHAKGVLRRAVGWIEVRLLCAGNVFLSGEHGFCHVPDLDPAEAYHALADACYRVRRAEKLRGAVDAVLVKDFTDATAPTARALAGFGYAELKTDPTMVIERRPEWRTFDDYVGAMAGKYRKRVRDARKKGRALRRRVLDADGIAAARDRIAELFDAVHRKAAFRIAALPLDYFPALAAALPDAFRLTAYELDGRMVGFTTTIAWGDALEGHFLGLDYAVNTSHAVYQNILYDDVAEGLARGASRVWLGRTALEIKSAIGAAPRPLACFLRHRGPLSNRLLKPIFGFIRPSPWTPRNPFGEEAGNGASDWAAG